MRIAVVNAIHWVGVKASVGDAADAPGNLLSRTSTRPPSKHTSTQAWLSLEYDDLNQLGTGKFELSTIRAYKSAALASIKPSESFRDMACSASALSNIVLRCRTGSTSSISPSCTRVSLQATSGSSGLSKPST